MGPNMGPIWGRQDRDAPQVGPFNFAIWIAHDTFSLTVKNDYDNDENDNNMMIIMKMITVMVLKMIMIN